MGEIIAIAMGVVIGDLLLQDVNVRNTVLIAAVLAAALDIVTIYVAGDAYMVLVRLLEGLTEGVLTWVAIGVLVRSANPERLGGGFVALQTIFQALLAAALALLVIPKLGWQGGFTVLAAIKLSPLLFSAQIAPVLQKLDTQGQKTPWSIDSALGLTIALVHLGAGISIWAYLEPLGKEMGPTSQAVQLLVFAVLVAQIASAYLSSMVVGRMREKSVLLGGSVAFVLLAFLWSRLGSGQSVAFWLLGCTLGSLWVFLQPFHIKLALAIDPSGQIAALVPAAQILGAAMGPLLASFVVAGEKATPVFSVSASLALVAFACVAILSVRARP